MKAYFLSLAVGVLVGVVYALFQVRSPAPPVIALVGLLGILVGEQLPSLVQRVRSGGLPAISWPGDQANPHAFGTLSSTQPTSTDASQSAAGEPEHDRK